MKTPKKNVHAQALGRLGGMARTKALSQDQRLASSQHANAMKKKRSKIRQLLGEEHE